MEHQKPPKLHIWSLCHAQNSSVELWVSNSLLSLFILYIMVPWISFSQSMHWHTHYPWTIMHCINHHFFCSKAECVIHPNGETTKSNCISNFLVGRFLKSKNNTEFPHKLIASPSISHSEIQNVCTWFLGSRNKQTKRGQNIDIIYQIKPQY